MILSREHRSRKWWLVRVRDSRLVYRLHAANPPGFRAGAIGASQAVPLPLRGQNSG